MTGSTAPHIDRLDYRPVRSTTVQDQEEHSTESHPGAIPGNRIASLTGSVFSRAADEIATRNTQARKKQIARYAGLVWAIINCLCAGSLTTFSLYGHIFQKRLGYSQYDINGISIAGEIALYLPVPISGYLCDRYGPAKPSVLAGVLSAAGYLIAAFTYRSGRDGGQTWPYGIMVLGFVLVGMAASCMYLSAVTCCVKNFGRGAHKGLALALPIAAFGLSAMWLSQLGSRVLYERRTAADGTRDHGDVDVFVYFLFLAGILFVGGLVGGALLQVVDEDEMIDEGVENLANSGLLEDSPFFRHGRAHDRDDHDYGAISRDDQDDSDPDQDRPLATSAERKSWLLGTETRLFLSDRTMWYLLVGFFFVTGPGECFVNNVGTMIGTLYPGSTPESGMSTTPATHVSVIAIASTIARVASGSLSDLFAPQTSSATVTRARGAPAAGSGTSAGVSRVLFLIGAAVLMGVGQMLTAAGFAQAHAGRFWVISALIGAGYGATFSLTPIIISVVWGVENFGTNWGIVAIVPSFGATVWGVVYSVVYQAGVVVGNTGPSMDGGDGADVLCHGLQCYRATFWAMTVSTAVACICWAIAWRGPGGWHRRGIEL